jgi:hypothetical protein
MNKKDEFIYANDMLANVSTYNPIARRGYHATSHDLRNDDGVCDFAGIGSGRGCGELGTDANRFSVLHRCKG